ncbi:MAG TPA: GNAT family N-acetyltransferase [bacterium]|nr:GNAT family N-acetyltransferase [bacterium]
MNKPSFLAATQPEDFKLIEALAGPIWRGHYTPIIGAGQVEYMLQQRQTAKAVEEQIRHGDFYYLIQTPEGEKSGYLSVSFRPDELFLSKLYLLKSHRGQGLARKALGFIEDLARSKGLKRITLTVHKQNPSVKIYQALGFRILESVITDIGGGYVMDDYRMALDLA